MVHKKGFTLIELAITLTIIGLVIGGSFQAIKMMRERNAVIEAKDQVKSAKDAVIGYALEYVDLPTWSEFANELAPVKRNVNDINKSFFYYADKELQSDIDICTFSTTKLKVDVYDGGVLDHSIDNVAFVVAAQSANHNIQTGVSNDGTYDRVRIYSPADTKDDNGADFIRAEEYDDAVSWVTLSELKKNVTCSSHALRFINDTLPKAQVGVPYSATLYVENNVTAISITCTNNGDKNISFSDPSFGGTPSGAGTSLRTCTASEASPGTQQTQKNFVISIDPAVSSGSGTAPACSSYTSKTTCESAGCTWSGPPFFGSCS